MAQAGGTQFNRAERELALLLTSDYDVKTIAAHIEVAISTAYLMIDKMCDKAQVAGRFALLVWILQHPACLFAGVISCPGLHVQPCECGSIFCLGMIAAQLPPIEINYTGDREIATMALLCLAGKLPPRPDLAEQIERVGRRLGLEPPPVAGLLPVPSLITK